MQVAQLDPTPKRLPLVVVTSVIRSAYQGESHGGVYLVDLETEAQKLVLDWDDAGIDWSGRGGDRGLRGVAFWNERVLLAASDEIFVYSRDFDLLASYANPYLRHCHEIDVDGDQLFLTSCGFDSILQVDLSSGRFVRGYCVRPPSLERRLYRGAAKLGSRAAERLLPRPRLRVFDPEQTGGPVPADTCHINSVCAVDGRIFLSGRVLDRVWAVENDRLEPYAAVPLKTHNAQPFRDGLLLNDTEGNRVVYSDRAGRVRRAFPVKHYDPASLENVELAQGRARQAFGRGLAVWADRYLIAGSSPATVSVHDLDTGETVKSLNLTLDVRNAVHGLEVWPFDGV